VVDGEERVTYADLAARATDAARALVAAGVQPGERVALWAPNSIEWIVAALGITTAGAVLVPINTRFKGTEAADIIGRSGARVLFTVRGFLDTDYPALLAASGTPLPSLAHTVLLAGDPGGTSSKAAARR
jgi:acyl-CoA synthetase (AMP-forming)/AMP-acid ligase II